MPLKDKLTKSLMGLQVKVRYSRNRVKEERPLGPCAAPDNGHDTVSGFSLPSIHRIGRVDEVIGPQRDIGLTIDQHPADVAIDGEDRAFAAIGNDDRLADLAPILRRRGVIGKRQNYSELRNYGELR